MKKANNFQIAKVQPEGVAYKKACISNIDCTGTL